MVKRRVGASLERIGAAVSRTGAPASAPSSAERRRRQLRRHGPCHPVSEPGLRGTTARRSAGSSERVRRARVSRCASTSRFRCTARSARWRRQRRALAALSNVGAADAADPRAGRACRTQLARSSPSPRRWCASRACSWSTTDELSIIDRQRALGLLRSAAGDGGLGVLMAVPDPPVMLHANEVRSLSRAR